MRIAYSSRLVKRKTALTFLFPARILGGKDELYFFAMNSSIFKANDIRALCPQDFAPEDGERIARAMVALFGLKRVLVGHDMRETSIPIETAVIRGLRASGVHVTRIGLSSTPMFNFAMGEEGKGYDLGLMITASHNPAQYNGIKVVGADRLQIGLGSGLEKIRDLVLSNEQFLNAKEQGGEDLDPDVLKRYLDRVFGLVSLSGLRTDRPIVADAGNGMEGMILPELARRLSPLKVESLYWELDGRFPNHEANPLKGETLHDLSEKVRATHALCGFAFDGDADRIGVVDDQGVQIPGDLLMALLAREVMRIHPHLHMLYDLRSSRMVGEAVEVNGGTAEMYKVGTAHIKRRMRETNALFAGELSMHFYFSDFGNCESGDFVLLLILQLLAREQKPLSVLWQDLKRYGHSGEHNYHVQNPHAMIEALKEEWSKLPEASLILLDGIRIDHWNGSNKDWWASIRPSNTEPLLRLNLETRDPAELALRVAEVEATLRRLDPSLTPAH